MDRVGNRASALKSSAPSSTRPIASSQLHLGISPILENAFFTDDNIAASPRPRGKNLSPPCHPACQQSGKPSLTVCTDRIQRNANIATALYQTPKSHFCQSSAGHMHIMVRQSRERPLLRSLITSVPQFEALLPRVVANSRMRALHYGSQKTTSEVGKNPRATKIKGRPESPVAIQGRDDGDF